MQELGAAQFDRSAVGVINADALANLMGDLLDRDYVRQLEQIMDVVPRTHVYSRTGRHRLPSIARRANIWETSSSFLQRVALQNRASRRSRLTHANLRRRARIRNIHRGGGPCPKQGRKLPLVSCIGLSPCNRDGRVVRWCGARIDIESHKESEDLAQRENLALRDEINTVAMFEEIVGNLFPPARGSRSG